MNHFFGDNDFSSRYRLFEVASILELCSTVLGAALLMF